MKIGFSSDYTITFRFLQNELLFIKLNLYLRILSKHYWNTNLRVMNFHILHKFLIIRPEIDLPEENQTFLMYKKFLKKLVTVDFGKLHIDI